MTTVKFLVYLALWAAVVAGLYALLLRIVWVYMLTAAGRRVGEILLGVTALAVLFAITFNYLGLDYPRPGSGYP